MVSFLIFVVGFIRRVHGGLAELKFLIQVVKIIAVFGIFIYLHIKLSNIHLDVLIENSKTITQLKVIEEVQRETKQMFEALQEGILVVQNGITVFENSICSNF